jgi:hypothetical protein
LHNRKAEEKKKQELEDAKKAIAAASRMKGKSGRDLFNQLVASNADLFLDDDDADDDCVYLSCSCVNCNVKYSCVSERVCKYQCVFVCVCA